ncbi:hypothetical protein [Streptomyces sp. NBC_01803]|uniref:hypothetical protein n=1 Tax=Streptomyces sp. NBC_01803 TaxID=2975946 RepID=UPI002DD9596E|nr:hypothetical protein [Streptomyces sp. NBC_01803]WSA42947.1 hypothetical protein OIE51_01245 [Streptomyces sp. NBC_01803]
MERTPLPMDRPGHAVLGIAGAPGAGKSTLTAARGAACPGPLVIGPRSRLPSRITKHPTANRIRLLRARA